jgi:hypothetical protein
MLHKQGRKSLPLQHPSWRNIQLSGSRHVPSEAAMAEEVMVVAAGHFAGGHGGGHFAGGHGGGHFAGGRQLGGRSGISRNAFGTQGGWNRFAGNGGGGGWGGWGGVGGGWGGWVGPVFWPFLLGDVFSYALWPYEYYYPFWSYGTAYDYDYAPYVPAYRHYGYGDLSNIYGDTGATGDTRYDTHAHQISPDVTQSCGSFAPGVTGLPIDRIRQAIHPTGEQITLVDDLATASSKASAVLKPHVQTNLRSPRLRGSMPLKDALRRQ